MTREMLLTDKISNQKAEVFDSEKKFQEYFHQMLNMNNYSLLIDRNVTMTELEIIVNDGLKIPDLLIPYRSELAALVNERNTEMNKFKKEIQDDINIINKIAYQILKETYKIFEKFTADVDENENLIVDDRSRSKIAEQ